MSEAADLVHLEREPYYLPLADEVEIFTAAYQARLPVLLNRQRRGIGHVREERVEDVADLVDELVDVILE